MGAPGFDDSPVAIIGKADLPKPITLIYPYYDNPITLHRHVAAWRDYPSHVGDFVSVVIVDDGSPRWPLADVLAAIACPFPLRAFRIDVDVRWNWLAARNIAQYYATDEWRLMTDIDHAVPGIVAEALIYGRHDPGTIYRLSRREHTGKAIHPHPNTTFLTGETFWKVGGYDEALSGHYGTDGDWRRRCAATAPVRLLRDELVRYEFVADSSTTNYKRKQPEDAGKKAIIAKRGKGWRPRVLSFPYHEIHLS